MSTITTPFGFSSTAAEATPVLVHLEATHHELWSRVRTRNARHAVDPNAIYFSEGDLLRYRTRFAPPGPDETHLTHNGNTDALLAALEAAAERPACPGSTRS